MIVGSTPTGRFVRRKLVGAPTPATEAVTVSDPATLLAVNTCEVAAPEALVTAVFTPPAKVPLAPLKGAANDTVTPLKGLPPASLTVACKGLAKAVLVSALCGVPPLAVMDAGAPTVLVSAKLAVVASPDTDAVTV
jgi:hypothetical protein